MIVSAGASNQKAGLQMERKPGFPFWTGGFFLSGTTEIECGNKAMIFSARSAVIIPPDTPYRLNIRKKQREIWMIFSTDMELQSILNSMRGSAPMLATAFQSPALWRELQTALKDLLRWWAGQTPDLLLTQNAMQRALLLTARSHDVSGQKISDNRIERVTAHLTQRLDEELPIDDLARIAGLSPSRFAHLFHDIMGLTPMKFLEMQRIEKAKHLLLKTNLPIQQIASSVGFPNAQHFAVRFKKLIGQSPSTFRLNPQRRFAELNPRGKN